ncbi:MAG TPA: DUF4231 domain-containing protein [Dehalococcoidia bacterium]|nr:DUF4231 domain-containing protein [Dehalococcoidia bacterium]
MNAQTPSSEPGAAFGAPRTLPSLFRAADAASARGQRHYLTLTWTALGVLVFAAAVGPLLEGIGEGGSKVPAILAAIALFFATALRAYALATRPERTWYEGRALAESTKTVAWRFAVAAAPFPADIDSSRERFVQRLREILSGFEDVPLESDDLGSQITPEMEALRAASLDERKRAYKTSRVQDQRQWYSSRAEHHLKSYHRFALLTLGLELAGGSLAVLKAAGAIDFDLVSLAAAAASALIAWENANQHSTLAKAYNIAAQELGSIYDIVESQRDEQAWSSFVDQAEEAISREHTTWRASRTGSPLRAPGDGLLAGEQEHYRDAD